jgi:hypothetical protein
MTEFLVGDFLACWDIRHFKPVVVSDIGDDLRVGLGSFLLARLHAHPIFGFAGRSGIVFHAGPLLIAADLATVRLLRTCQIALAQQAK